MALCRLLKERNGTSQFYIVREALLILIAPMIFAFDAGMRVKAIGRGRAGKRWQLIDIES